MKSFLASFQPGGCKKKSKFSETQIVSTTSPDSE